MVETTRVRRFVRWSFVLGQSACVWYVLVPAVAARLFVDRDPGVGAAGTFASRARHPRLTSSCRCRGIVRGSVTHVHPARQTICVTFWTPRPTLATLDVIPGSLDVNFVDVDPSERDLDVIPGSLDLYFVDVDPSRNDLDVSSGSLDLS